MKLKWSRPILARSISSWGLNAKFDRVMTFSPHKGMDLAKSEFVFAKWSIMSRVVLVKCNLEVY